MNENTTKLKRQIRLLLLFFITGLIISGATAIPVYEELKIILALLPAGNIISGWFQKVYTALEAVQTNYPFILYGYDWLAFGHFAIAVAFLGPVKDPVKNIWIVEFGMIACTLIIPYAFACSAFRGIPVGWTLIDCSFGIFGIIPLWICRKKILLLKKLEQNDKLNLIF